MRQDFKLSFSRLSVSVPLSVEKDVIYGIDLHGTGESANSKFYNAVD